MYSSDEVDNESDNGEEVSNEEVSVDEVNTNEKDDIEFTSESSKIDGNNEVKEEL